MASRISHPWSVISSTVLILVIIGTLSVRRARAQCQYDVTIIQAPDCPPFGAQPTIGTGINNLGHIVGYYDVCLGDTQRAFLWTPEGGMQTLEMPDGVLSARASDINDVGQIVGTMGGVVTPFRAYLYDQGKFLDLGVLPGAHWSGASALNLEPQIVGWSSNVTEGPHEAFLWEDGAMTALDLPMGPNSGAADINEGKSQIVGWMGTANGIDAHAFLWDDGLVTDLGVIPGGFTAQARALNSLNQILITGSLQQGEGSPILSRSFLWEDGELTDLGVLPGFDRCTGFDLNDGPEVVGVCSMSSNPNFRRGFVWRGGLMTDLNHLIAPDSGILIKTANAINDVGEITGQARLGWDSVAVVLTPPALEIGDLNRDFAVDAFDLALLLGSWGTCPQDEDCLADLNDDGSVGPFDLAELLGHWAPCPEDVPTGGCRFCHPDGAPSCEILTGEECEAAGGTYFGDESFCYACFADACDPTEEACCEIVCAVDPFCCEKVWDEICADLEEKLCE